MKAYENVLEMLATREIHLKCNGAKTPERQARLEELRTLRVIVNTLNKQGVQA